MTHADASAWAGLPARRVAYTTGQVARLLGCSDYTVCRWIDAGRLPGHRVPAPGGGRPARRVFHDDLVAFCREHGLTRALATLEGPAPPPGPVALCGLDDALAGRLAALLEAEAVIPCADLLVLGLAFTRVPPPRAVVLGGLSRAGGGARRRAGTGGAGPPAAAGGAAGGGRRRRGGLDGGGMRLGVPGAL